mgnify:CR=1 FL=1
MGRVESISSRGGCRVGVEVLQGKDSLVTKVTFVRIAFPAEAKLDVIAVLAAHLQEDCSGDAKRMGGELAQFVGSDVGVDVGGDALEELRELVEDRRLWLKIWVGFLGCAMDI